MSYTGVESSLSEAMKLFDAIVSRRERLIKDSRDIISLSARTIVSVHTSNFIEAKKLKNEAKQRLEDLRKIAESDLTRYLLTPEQEFVECSVMLAVATRKTLPSRRQLGVTPSSYVLGMLDVIGELKRSVYDSIRKDEFDNAERMFSAMENLYLIVSPFAVYDHIAQGVKRKLDVARILIEDTRAIVTEEARRRDFVHAVNELAIRLGKTPIESTTRIVTNKSTKLSEPLDEETSETNESE
ncbi:MAG: RNA-binding protein [Nitrososphaerota archaeon]|nr:RNA-binding protein [Nitrososphaerota archaeon]